MLLYVICLLHVYVCYMSDTLDLDMLFVGICYCVQRRHLNKTHDNPPTESLSPASRTVRGIAFSHHQCLFSTLSLHVIPRHSAFNTWLSCALYDHSDGVLFSPYSSRHLPQWEMCARNSKKLGSSWVIYRFVVILEHKTERPTSKQMVKQTHFRFVYLFCPNN
jgi:hypothetical protein